jgi:hypothetical protein
LLLLSLSFLPPLSPMVSPFQKLRNETRSAFCFAIPLMSRLIFHVTKRPPSQPKCIPPVCIFNPLTYTQCVYMCATDQLSQHVLYGNPRSARRGDLASIRSSWTSPFGILVAQRTWAGPQVLKRVGPLR